MSAPEEFTDAELLALAHIGWDAELVAGPEPTPPGYGYGWDEIEDSVRRTAAEGVRAVLAELARRGHLQGKTIGRPPSWYRTMELDWAARHFGFPADPSKGDVHTASDGGRWEFELTGQPGVWELAFYPPGGVR